MGPDKHTVFYPVKGGTQFNMVLLRPDNLPTNARVVKGDIEEMRDTFKGWDPAYVPLKPSTNAVLTIPHPASRKSSPASPPFSNGNYATTKNSRRGRGLVTSPKSNNSTSF
jgi:hypothetical protein